MSWMQKLHETYERCMGKQGAEDLLPIAHTTQQAHIEVVLDEQGNFRRATVIDKDDAQTLIPCTEESGGRAGSKPRNHPLCDKLQYVARDFVSYGGLVTSGFDKNPAEPFGQYLDSLQDWVASDPHPKLQSILAYVKSGALLPDLIREGVLPGPENATGDGLPDAHTEALAISKVLPKGQSPFDAFVRWRVEGVASMSSGTWEDSSLIESWIRHYQSGQETKGLCMVSGQQAPLALQHPAKLRHGADKAKLISSNDLSGYTFRGRFTSSDEAAGVSFEVTQKAHNALRWLIARQGSYRDGGQAVCSWATSGARIPDPLVNTFNLLGIEIAAEEFDLHAETAQSFALRLAKAIAGYGSQLDPSDDIVVMAIDSATPGRMGITFYRELRGSEFLSRVLAWHQALAWHQDFSKHAKFIGAPSPRDIAEAAYGRRLDENLRIATVERLLPCIVDAAPIPLGLVSTVAHRAQNRVGLDAWEWEKVLGIACSLFRGYHRERNYQMSLETDRNSRDYLFGRLLAVADNLENYALNQAGERRDTTAARLMQRFADRPSSTWRTISLALRPYMSRLRSSDRSAGFLVARERLLDEIMNAFAAQDFIDDSKLSGEFLLGFHCQRRELLTSKQAASSAEGAPPPSDPQTQNLTESV